MEVVDSHIKFFYLERNFWKLKLYLRVQLFHLLKDFQELS